MESCAQNSDFNLSSEDNHADKDQEDAQKLNFLEWSIDQIEGDEQVDCNFGPGINFLDCNNPDEYICSCHYCYVLIEQSASLEEENQMLAEENAYLQKEIDQLANHEKINLALRERNQMLAKENNDLKKEINKLNNKLKNNIRSRPNLRKETLLNETVKAFIYRLQKSQNKAYQSPKECNAELEKPFTVIINPEEENVSKLQIDL